MSSTVTDSPGAASPDVTRDHVVHELPGFARGPVLAASGVFLLVELVAAARYGLHRDELYFLACARHLAWGYVDQPPLVPAVAWVVSGVIGPFAWALRLLPALVGAVTVGLSAMMARELGGGRCAQTIAAVATAASAELLAAFHLLSTTAFDYFFWAVILWLTLRLLGTDDSRLLVPLGVVSGIALLNKWNVAFLIGSLVVGIGAGRKRRLLWSKHALVGALALVVLLSPDIIWNFRHDWAQVAMLHSLHSENSTIGASIAFLPSQLILVGPALAALWIAGLIHLWRDPIFRGVAISYVILAGWFSLTGAKAYYLGGIYVVLFAAGGVVAERRVSQRGKPGRVRGWIALMVAGAVLSLPLTLPLLPESSLPRGSWEGQVNKDLSATVGWPSYVGQIARFTNQLTPDQRSRLVLLTGDYGAAGAIDLYGSRYRLPAAISGHNTYWWWGTGDSPDDWVAIATNVPRASLRRMFGRVRLLAYVQTPHGVWTEEHGDPIFLCTQQFRTWSQVWPSFRQYG